MCLHQCGLGNCFNIEEGSELFGELFNEVDLAIEMQDLCSKGPALRFARCKMFQELRRQCCLCTWPNDVAQNRFFMQDRDPFLSGSLCRRIAKQILA